MSWSTVNAFTNLNSLNSSPFGANGSGSFLANSTGAAKFAVDFSASYPSFQAPAGSYGLDAGTGARIGSGVDDADALFSDFPGKWLEFPQSFLGPTCR